MINHISATEMPEKRNVMKKTLAHIFSWLFLPLLMPFYGLYLSLYIPSEELSLSGKGITCVLSCNRRKAEENTTRSKSLS